MKTLALLGTVTGIAFFAGIRLFATVLTVGLCLRYGLLHLMIIKRRINTLRNRALNNHQ
jgi:hypothetical protein